MSQQEVGCGRGQKCMQQCLQQKSCRDGNESLVCHSSAVSEATWPSPVWKQVHLSPFSCLQTRHCTLQALSLTSTQKSDSYTRLCHLLKTKTQGCGTLKVVTSELNKAALYLCLHVAWGHIGAKTQSHCCWIVYREWDSIHMTRWAPLAQ